MRHQRIEGFSNFAHKHQNCHLDILVDDEFVQQMTEGRDMIIKIKILSASHRGGEGPSADDQLGIWLEYRLLPGETEPMQ